MSIVINIREKLKDAMRSKNQVALDTYRGVLSAFTNELVALGKTPQDEMSDEEAQKVITRLIKQRRDSIDQFEKGGRNDLAESEKSQLALLAEFLPPQMSKDDVKKIAEAKKAELGINDKTKIGVLTGAVMKALNGQADGAIVKKIVESLFE